jgi:four helix bundle protein
LTRLRRVGMAFMSTVNRFEDLKAWQLARELTKDVYRLSGAGKFSRDFPLRDQIRRAVVSIMSNIAEGFERDGNKEFLQFLSQAKGSCGEVRAQLYVALDQSYIDSGAFSQSSTATLELSRVVSGLMHYLRESDLRGRKFPHPPKAG